MTKPMIIAMVKKIMPAKLRPLGSLPCLRLKNTRPKISPIKRIAGHICSRMDIRGKWPICVKVVVKF